MIIQNSVKDKVKDICTDLNNVQDKLDSFADVLFEHEELIDADDFHDARHQLNEVIKSLKDIPTTVKELLNDIGKEIENDYL